MHIINKSHKYTDFLFVTILFIPIFLALLYVIIYSNMGTGRMIGEIPWYKPIIHSFIGLTSFSVAFLSFARYHLVRESVCYWMGICFVSVGILMIFFILTCPDLLPEGKSFIKALPNTSAWIDWLQVIILSVTLPAAVLLKWPKKRSFQKWNWLWSVVTWIIALTLIAILSIAFESKVPHLIGSKGNYTSFSLIWDWIFLLFFISGTIFAIRRYLLTSNSLFGYVSLSLIAFLFLVIALLLGTGNYDVWYYLSHIIMTGGFITIAFGLLTEYIHLYQHEREQAQELKLKTEKLIQVEARLILAQKAGHAGVFDWDIINNKIIWTRQLEELFGLPEGGFGGTYQSWIERVYDGDRLGIETAFNSWMTQHPEYIESDYRIIRANDHRLRWLHVNAHLSYSKDGTPARMIGTNTDITERKQYEEALRIANEQLREDDQRKNEFLGMLSHELRNPLTPIKNSLYIINRVEAGSDKAKHALQVMARQVDLLIRLVDDLLDITRITRNKIQLQLKRLELNELVERTLEDHRLIFEKAGVQLKFQAAPTSICIEGDEDRLSQVVGNLLSNAVKFTSEGGHVSVSVSADTDNRQAILQVTDTGKGFAPEFADKIFEAFMQTDTTLDRSKGGLGLGLALVKGLIELHGGSISANSAGPGKGSQFTIRLPLIINTPGKNMPEQPAAEKTPNPLHILIIEDNVDIANSLSEVLELNRHKVSVVYNGCDGIAKAHELHPDIIFCDIGLPGMDGYAVARAIRADETLKKTHLVALSGYAQPEDLQHTAEAGFEKHLAKPPNLEQVNKIIASLMGQ